MGTTYADDAIVAALSIIVGTLFAVFEPVFAAEWPVRVLIIGLALVLVVQSIRCIYYESLINEGAIEQ